MTNKQEIKKKTELWALNAARAACPKIPGGNVIQREEPDFLITTPSGALAVETTELLIPGKHGEFSPVKEEHFHQKLVRKAEALYRSTPHARQIAVSVRFNNGGWRDMQAMATALVEFVSVHFRSATPVRTFYQGFPALFFSVTIETDRDRSWTCSECCGFTVSDVYQQLAFRIQEKNKRLESYRANISNVPIWLLIYTTFGIARSMSIPHGIDKWTQPFEFDRVLFYSCLDQSVAEISRAT